MVMAFKFRMWEKHFYDNVNQQNVESWMSEEKLSSM